MRHRTPALGNLFLAGALALGLGLSGCGGGSEDPAPPAEPAATEPEPPATPEPPTPPAPPAEPSAAAGAPLYATYCASCHGAAGEGDGPVSAGLNPKPAKHSDGEYMNALDHDYLVKVIKEGGGAVGKSPLMAPWGGTLSDAQINDVIAFMRSLAKPPYPGS